MTPFPQLHDAFAIIDTHFLFRDRQKVRDAFRSSMRRYRIGDIERAPTDSNVARVKMPQNGCQSSRPRKFMTCSRHFSFRTLCVGCSISRLQIGTLSRQLFSLCRNSSRNYHNDIMNCHSSDSFSSERIKTGSRAYRPIR